MDRIEDRQDERDKAMQFISLALQKIVDRLDHHETGDMAMHNRIKAIEKENQQQNIRDARKAGYLAGAIAVGGAVAAALGTLAHKLIEHINF